MAEAWVREGLAALATLRGEWAALCRRAPRATAFQWPQWLLPLCEHLEREPPLASLLWRDGRLAGLLVALERHGELRLCGEGPSDRLDVILEDGLGRAEAEALLEPFLRQRVRAVLEPLSPGSPLLEAHPAGFARRVEPAGMTPVLRLDAALSEIPRGLRKELAYLRRRADREGGLTAHVPDLDVTPLLREFFALHERRWESRGEGGVLQGEALWRFHHAAAQGLHDEGLLRLRVLRLGGAPLAATYGFSAHGRAAYYLGGFDPALRRLSPGTLAVGAAADHAASEGCAALDFLRGTEPYKRAWGATDRPLFRLVLDRSRTVAG